MSSHFLKHFLAGRNMLCRSLRLPRQMRRLLNIYCLSLLVRLAWHLQLRTVPLPCWRGCFRLLSVLPLRRLVILNCYCFQICFFIRLILHNDVLGRSLRISKFFSNLHQACPDSLELRESWQMIQLSIIRISMDFSGYYASNIIWS